MKLRIVAMVSAALALSACVAYVPTGPAPAYAYGDSYATYAAYGPPAAPLEVVPVAPGPAYVWTPGFYVWGGRGYSWRGGRWEVPPAGRRTWNPGYWSRQASGRHAWTPGHWR